MATIHQYTRDEYMGSGQRCSKRGPKSDQKRVIFDTKNGPKMSSFWRSFWTSNKRYLGLKVVQKEGPK